MATRKITTIFGDGIGPEVTNQSIKVLNTIGEVFQHHFEFERALMGAEAIDATGTALPQETIEKAKNSDAVLFGAVGHPKYDNDPTLTVRPEQGILGIRKALQLYANIRPIQTIQTVHHLSPIRFKPNEHFDFVVYRELTGGLYFGERGISEDGNAAFDTSRYTRAEIERIATHAFKAAMQRRKKLTLVDKSNVLDTSRLWRIVVKEMAAQYPEVRLECLYVDNAAIQLILNPTQFDVILTDNMFGDIISDEASILTGSLGLLPSASIGINNAMFEPVHGAYPQAAGKDIANPIGSILSTAMMLDYFGMHEEAGRTRQAVNWTLQHGFVTKDIDPINFYFTSTVGDLVCDYIYGKVVETVNKGNIELRKSTII